MLTIRKSQIWALGKPAESAFCTRAVDHLHSVVPEICALMSHEQLLDSVVFALARCRSIGTDREVDVLRYLNLMYVFGFKFERLQWASVILAERSMQPRAILEWLNSHALYVATQGAKGADN